MYQYRQKYNLLVCRLGFKPVMSTENKSSAKSNTSEEQKKQGIYIICNPFAAIVDFHKASAVPTTFFSCVTIRYNKIYALMAMQF